MYYKSELSELAINIESVIAESLDSLKLSETKNQVNSAIDHAIDEVRDALDKAGDKLDAAGSRLNQSRERSTERVQRNVERIQRRTARRQNWALAGRAGGESSYQPPRYVKQVPDISRMTPSQLLRYSQIPVSRNPAGKVSGVLCTVFGALGLGFFGIPALVFLVSMLVGDPVAEFEATTIFTTLTAGSGFLMGKGIGLRARVRRFYRYLRIINNRTYCDTREIISSQAREAKLVMKDLKAMIRLNMFREGHLDENGATLMLTDSTYQEYLRTKNLREQEARIQKEEQAMIAEDPQLAALKEAVEEGRRHVELIRKANEEIAGEEVSAKLYRLEDVTRKIFEHIQSHPQKLSEIRKFMSYYLPTTLKLVHVYCELEKQPVNGENIVNAKADIERTLDTINVAFENLLDDLFEETAMDVSTDISVLETMLAQEGLTESGFGAMKE